MGLCNTAHKQVVCLERGCSWTESEACEDYPETPTPPPLPPPSPPHNHISSDNLHFGMTLCIPCIPRDVARMEAALFPSIVKQTLQPDEVIVALSSSDASQAAGIESRWVSSIPNMRVMHTHELRGPGQNRNRCAFAASQPIVSFMDADDEMHPQRLQILHEVLGDTNATCALHSFTTTPIETDIRYTWRDKIHSLVYFDLSWECLRGREMLRRAEEFISEAMAGRRSYPFEQHGHPTCFRWVLSQVHFEALMEGEDTHFNSNVWHRFNQSVFVPLPLVRWEPSGSQPIMQATVSSPYP